MPAGFVKIGGKEWRTGDVCIAPKSHVNHNNYQVSEFSALYQKSFRGLKSYSETLSA